MIDDDDGLVKTTSQGTAEVLHAGVGVKEDDGAALGAHVAEGGGEKRSLRAEAPAAGTPDGSHQQEADSVGTDDAESVHHVGRVGVEAKHPPTAGARAGARLFLHVVAGFGDGNRPGQRSRASTRGPDRDCTVRRRRRRSPSSPVGPRGVPERR